METTFKFAEILEELIFESGMDFKNFARTVGISPSCITEYIRKENMPTVVTLVKIAEFFNRSTDFLLGREPDNRTLKFKVCPPFSQQIEFLKAHFKCSSYSIYTNTDIPKSRFYEWKNGKRVPTVENVVKLADYFDCRVDFILGRES